MPITLRDFISFPFNGGRGIRTDQLDGAIDRSQLAANAGEPTLLYTTVGTAYDDATHLLTVGLRPGAGPPALGTSVWIIMPAGMPRTSDAMTISIGGAPSVPLRAISGQAVSARQLTPGCLHEVLVLVGQVRFVAPLPSVRDQDWELAAFWSDENLEDEAVDADQFGGIETFSTSTITVPAYVPGARDRNAYLFLGVPMDAPDIVRASGFEVSIDTRLSLEQVPAAQFAGQVGGSDYRWVRSRSRQVHVADGFFGAGRRLRIAYDYV